MMQLKLLNNDLYEKVNKHFEQGVDDAAAVHRSRGDRLLR